MNPAAVGLVVIFLIVGCLMGWHAKRAQSAHGDLRATRGRLPGFRKTRMRSGLLVIVLVVIVLLLTRDMIHS
jgi:hypothetical protein